MHSYFCGWYFRCQSERQTLAVIPSFHRTNTSAYDTIQLITDTRSFGIRFPPVTKQKWGESVAVAGNRFGKEGMCLNICTPELRAAGRVRFGGLSPLDYDIMGPFRYVPFMQCRHSVYSMRHTVDGMLVVNGTPYVFRDAVGYWEGDRGYDFPKRYVWTQCFFPDGSLMLSVADIPFGGLRFTGVIGVIRLGGREYRLATYLGAKAVRIGEDEIVVRQGRFVLTVRPQDRGGHPLRAPVGGDMTRTIHEHPSCRIDYCFEEDGVPRLVLEAQPAAFELEYQGKA